MTEDKPLPPEIEAAPKEFVGWSQLQLLKEQKQDGI